MLPCCSTTPATTVKDLDALTRLYAALADSTRLLSELVAFIRAIQPR